jgi:uncharacterized membrane protein YfcA
MPFDLSIGAAGLIWVTLFVASFLRGYTGFGMSAIVLAVAALVTDPRPLIPVIFTAEVLLTLVQIPSIRGRIDWPLVLALLLGAAVGVPLAVPVLAGIGTEAARLTISAIVLAMSLILFSGWTLKRRVGRAGQVGTGVVSGVANAAGVGGLPVVVLLSAQPMPPERFRATMIAYLTGLDLYTVPVMAAHGMVGADSAWALALALPTLVAGTILGGIGFAFASPRAFRRVTVWLLGLLALMGIARALL